MTLGMHMTVGNFIRTYNRAIAYILLLCSIVYVCYTVVSTNSFSNARFDAARFKKMYERSQWMVPNSKEPISDSTLYTYAGYLYANGYNPTLINPEVPPLAKYIIGLSINLTGNYALPSMLFAALSLVLIFMITHKATQSVLSSSVAVFLTATHSIFIDQIMNVPQLEIFQLVFLLLIIYAEITFTTSRKIWWTVLAGIALGGFVSIKVFMLFFTLLNAWLVLWLLSNRHNYRRQFGHFLAVNAIGLTCYTLLYTRFFILGATLRSFAGMHKWIYEFYSSSTIASAKLYGAFIPLIMVNKWRFWSEGYPYVSYGSWTILWPVLFILGIIAVYVLLRRNNKDMRPTVYSVGIFLVCYMAFLFFLPIFPRYLVLLFVPMHILIALFFDTIVKT